MRNLKLKSQKGAISVFVLVSMLFFVVTIVGIYVITSMRAQSQTESVEVIQGQYYTEGEENIIYEEKVSNTTVDIPIYTKEHLYSIGTGKQVEIEGVEYTFSSKATYKLQNDIIINIDDSVIAVGNNDATIDYNNYEIYYYYEGSYYDLADEFDYTMEVNGSYFKIR